MASGYKINFHLTTWILTICIIYSNLNTVENYSMQFYQRYYDNFQELGCSGMFRERMFLKLEVVCSACGDFQKNYTYATACRKDCYMTNDFTKCLQALGLPPAIFKRMRQGRYEVAGRVPALEFDLLTLNV